MDDCKFRMVEMMHLYLSGAITDEEMQELQKWLDAAVSYTHLTLPTTSRV